MVSSSSSPLLPLLPRLLLPLLLVLLVLLLLSTSISASTQQPNRKAIKNVLFLAIDDLRVQFGFKGDDMNTPNLDALAQRSLYLSAHHCQYPLCNPSRTSLLTGRRPDTTLVFDNSKYWREYTFPFTTLPQHLKDSHGFLTLNYGKIFHAPTIVDDDYPHSWSRPVFLPEDYWGKDVSWREITPEQESAMPLTDDLTVEQVTKVIKEELAHSEQPFFLAVGLNKPHLPFYAPSRHYLPYAGPEDTELPDNQFIPEGMPQVAWHNYLNELGDYSDITELGVTGMFNTSMPEFKVRELRRAYYASVSYADEMAGKILSSLEENGLENNTMVVLWGDHGWHLGEHLLWQKQVLYERVTLSPVFIHIPGMTDHGVETSTFTEHVDLYPTILDALGLPAIPVCSENSQQELLCTEGKSVLPLVTAPEVPIKTKAFTHYRSVHKGLAYLGVGLRVEGFRYVEWPFWSNILQEPFWDRLAGRELYDRTKDPEENVNVAEDPAYSEVVKELSVILRAGWRDGADESE